MVPQWVSELLPSDWLMFAFLVVQLFFVLDYAILTPWWRHALGWIILEYGIGVLVLMGLIVYGVIFGQRVDEWLRIIAMMMVLAGAIGKEVLLKVSRHQGRIERRERRRAAHAESHKSEGSLMSDLTPTLEEVKDVTTIWYKAQRVVRTAFTTVLTVLPLVPQIVQIVQGQWSTEWLTGVAVQAVAINAVLTAVIAIPTVNAFLTKIGLGSVPRSAIYKSSVTGNVIVKADAKAADGRR